MPIEIIKQCQNIAVTSIVTAIYGEPGVGKTSLGGSSSRSLVLDCDKGAYRSAYRKDVLKINSYADVLELLRSEETLENYDTLVIDTVSTLLNFILLESEKQNPGKATTRSGNPTQFGWGEMRATFNRLVARLKTLGKDVVLISQEKTVTKGDDEQFRPDISGGSYSILFESADFVGRMYMVQNQRTLNFNPSETQRGKNSAGVPILQIPDFKAEPDYFAGIIARMKAAVGRASVPPTLPPAVQTDASAPQPAPSKTDTVADQRAQFSAEWQKRLAAVKTTAILDALAAESLAFPVGTARRNISWDMLLAAAKNLGAVWDEERKVFGLTPPKPVADIVDETTGEIVEEAADGW